MPEFLVPDAFSAFFLACFLIGILFVVFSALMGVTQDLSHFAGFDGHGDAGSGHTVDVGHGSGGADLGHGHAASDVGHGSADAHGSHHDGRSTSASPLNLMTLMAFLAWFGGAGYILYTVNGVFLPLSLLGGVAAGLLAGWLVYLFLVKFLLPGTMAGDLRGQTLIGTAARVTIPIQANRVGEIVYTLHGARHSDGARSVDGRAIERDKEVVIVRFEQGIAYVEEWERFRDDLEILSTPSATSQSDGDAQQPALRADSEKD